ncbi:MAG TPA: hypothetical protein VG028_13315 [Terriglobia bacterium]|nr:hypothetical protein [Terriglobia bacterium]
MAWVIVWVTKEKDMTTEKTMSLANDNESTNEVEDFTYGELTMVKLEEFFGCADKPYAERKDLPVPTKFWDWRNENKSRSRVLRQAGVSLYKAEGGWQVDLTTVSADTLDNALDASRQWKRTEKELKERARIYLRQCDRMKRQPGGQFGGPA